MDTEKFKALVWKYYREHGRHDIPWRKTKDPYKILVSEMMLQQTQVARVIPKYKNWMKRFPNVRALADASAREVLIEWQGLGYNRRVLYLKKVSEKIRLSSAKSERSAQARESDFFRDYDKLISLPGIGQSTAGAITAFAYNIPVVFIETNIRSVFIHHFFLKSRKVSDEKILPLIEKTLDKKDPREWYYALMDYGVYLKGNLPNPSRKSRHHAKQSRFKGSRREIRATILREILKRPRSEKEIEKTFVGTEYDILDILSSLVKEGFIVRKARGYRISA